MDHPTLNFLQRWQQSAVGYGEVNPMSIISLCIFFFFLILLLKLLRGSQKKIINNKLAPSPPKLPIIGNLHQLGTLPHRSLAALSEKYGPDLMHLKLGKTPTLVVSSAKMVKEMMTTHDIKFSNRPQTTAAKALFYQCQDVGFAPYGEHWKQARKICALGIFSGKRVDSFQYVRDEEVCVLMDRIRKACVGGESVNLSQLLASTSNNILSRCVLGEKFEDENGNSRFGDVPRKVLTLLATFCVADFFPAFGWIDVVRGFNGKLKKIAKKMDGLFDMIIEEHKVKLSIGKSEDKMDFVDIMLQLEEDHMLEYHFTRDDIKAIFQDMFVAGSDTTAASMEWTMTELIRNPRVMKKVQEEVRRIVGKKAIKIETNEINKMEYLKCVLKESLRLHPPAPLLAPRETSDIINIGGYDVASGTTVLVNAWSIQRDPNIWENPNEFVPERFMNNKIEKKLVEEFEYFPFGGGRRKCPGISFGLASFECELANLLYWFDWKLPDGMTGELLDMTEQFGTTLHKKIPLYLKPAAFTNNII